MAAPKQTAARKLALEGRPAPLDMARTTCPFLDETIQYKQINGGKWIAFTSLWTSRPYDFRDMLVFVLSHNGGTAPNLPRPGVTPVIPPPEAEAEAEEPAQ